MTLFCTFLREDEVVLEIYKDATEIDIEEQYIVISSEADLWLYSDPVVDPEYSTFSHHTRKDELKSYRLLHQLYKKRREAKLDSE